MKRVPPLESWQPLGEAVELAVSLTVSATDSSTTDIVRVTCPPMGHAITALFSEPPMIVAAVSL